MAENPPDLAAWIAVPLEPRQAFDMFVDDLVKGLAERGMEFRPGPAGRVTQAGGAVGRVVVWDPGAAIRLEWRSAPWTEGRPATADVRFEPFPGGTRVSLAYRGWTGHVQEIASELAGWFAHQVAAPIFEATAPAALGDWITDRRARRPSGAAAREGYREPVFHRPNFKLLLKTLALTADDRLLEVGCGGGAFLREALRSGCRAAAVDHSADMVRVAREENREAVRDGRLEVVQAEAGWIPYASARFTCAALTNVFGFLSDPGRALSEIHRLLAPSGRLALFTLGREAAGTMAAPEPMASRIRFYEDAELRRLARDAGFAEARVERPDLEPFAREAGLPEDQVAMFRGPRGSQLLIARKA